MLLENELIEMRWHHSNKEKYTNLGYVFTKNKDTFYAKVKDVLKCSCGVKIPVKCDYCGEIYYPTVRNYEKAHSRKDKDCCVSCKGKEIRETLQKKYGVDSIMEIPSARKKVEETCLIKYGATSPLGNSEIFNKTKESLNAHYNLKNGIKELYTAPGIAKRIEQTNMKRYGGKAPLCSSEIRAKVTKTMYQNGTCLTSKPQILLNQMIIDLYGNSELNYPCDKVCLDCMTIVNGNKIDIEYDGWFWHKDKQVEDRRRDNFVKSQGYKIIRFVAYENRVPTEQELCGAIDKIVTANRNFIKVELNKI